MNDDQAGRIDAAAILRGIDDDARRAQEALSPSTPFLYAVWGAAWVVGFGGFLAGLAPDDDPLIPFPAGAVIGAVALIAAIVLSTVHSVRRSAGSRGPSVVQGAVHGNLYAVSFTTAGLLAWRLAAEGVPFEVMLSYWVAVPCLIVGMLSVSGAVMWNERSQLWFGGWTLAVGLGSLLAPAPLNLLAGVLGGFGFLALAVLEARRPGLTSGPITRADLG